MPVGLGVSVGVGLAAPHRASGPAGAVASWATSSLGASPPWSRMSRDGFSWDSGQSWIRDGRGSWIGLVVDDTGPAIGWAFSNDGGATFSTSAGIDIGGLVRGSLVYEPVDDCVYALFEGLVAATGMLVRRYQITRTTPGNTSTAIASIATSRDTTLNIQLDFQDTAGTVLYASPQLRLLTDNPAWTRGALVAAWSVVQSGGGVDGGELRSSMLVIAGYGNAADNTAGNWTAPAGAGTKFITQGPKTGLGWSQLFAISTPSEVFGVTARLASGAHAGDLVAVYYAGSIASYRLARWAWNPATYVWGTATRTTLLPLVGSGVDADAGYPFRPQVTSQVSHDATNDRVYVGLAQWAGDGVGGERWVLVEVDLANANAVATTVVYEAARATAGADIFVTGSAYYDPTAGRTLVTWTDLPGKAAWSRTYNRTVPVAAAVSLYNGSPVDIPTIAPWRDASNRAVVLFRDFNAAAANNPPTYTPPYQGFSARGTWS